jgi:hypothetical protein
MLTQTEIETMSAEVVKEFLSQKVTRYHIYGKMGSMKKMKAVAGDRFTTNLIYAEIYTVHGDEEMARLNKELAFLNTQGTFELRKIKGE